MITKCVACDSQNLNHLLDLGNQPPANDFLADISNYCEYPLGVNYCSSCYHVQLTFSLNPDLLFRDYVYVSGTTKTLDIYFSDFVNKCNKFELKKKKVLEIASNDGSLLRKFNEAGWESIGIDPAINLISLSSSNKVVTVPDYFNLKLVNHLAKDYSLIVAMNVFAHTHNPLEILLAAKKILDEDGIFIIQTSQSDMIINNQIDTIYHEHISFFNVRSMQKIIERSGMYLSGLEIAPIHGNSYLWYVTKKAKKLSQQKDLLDRLKFEENQDIFIEDKYLEYSKSAIKLRQNINDRIQEFKNRDYKVVVYGAAAKGNTFLNFCKIQVDHVYDDNELKIGKYSPVGRVIVEKPGIMASDTSKYLFIITAWNFSEEIIKKIKKIRKNNDDSYLLYYPEVFIGKIND